MGLSLVIIQFANFNIISIFQDACLKQSLTIPDKLRGRVLRQLACTVGVELPSLTISTFLRSERYPQWCLYIKATIALAKWRNVEWQQPRGIDNVIFCLKSYLFLGNLILLLVHGCVVGHRSIAPFLCLCSLQENYFLNGRYFTNGRGTRRANNWRNSVVEAVIQLISISFQGTWLPFFA